MSKSKAAQRQNISSDSDDEDEATLKDDEFDLSMDEDERERFNQMSEKEREIEIFKRLEQREINKTREQIKRKLEMAAGKKQTGPSSVEKKKRRISMGSEDVSESEAERNGAKASTDEEEEGELATNEKDDESSEDDDDDDKAKPSSSSTQKVKHSAKPRNDDNGDGEEEEEEEEEGDTAYHKPSDLVSKHNKKVAMADLLSKRRDKKQAEERRKKEIQKAALDLDEIFGSADNNKEEDGKSMSSSSSSSSPASSRSSSPVSNKSRAPSPVSLPIDSRSDLMKCQALRRRLSRIVHAPFFQKTIVGCFVRVQIGSNDGKATYRIAQVVDVVETAKIYEVEPGTDVRTNKGLKLKICNNDAQRVIRLEFVSNGECTDSEYAFWLKRMKETETPLPTIDFVQKKQKELVGALNYNYTDAEINLMVREKQRFKRQPTNFAFQKAELLKQKEDAEQNGDTERVRDLQHQINDLEEKAKKIEHQRTKNLSAVTAINQRNRDHMKQTFLSAECMQSNEHFRVKDDDPFTRKSARMKLVTGVSKPKHLDEALNGAPSSSTAATGGVAVGRANFDVALLGSLSASSIGSAKGGSGGSSSSLPPPSDLFYAHGIDVNIDLGKVLPASTSSAFRAPPIGASSSLASQSSQQSRPPQKSSSSSSTRTLTLEEYKKKYSTRMQ